jgi:hypothetical protein
MWEKPLPATESKKTKKEGGMEAIIALLDKGEGGGRVKPLINLLEVQRRLSIYFRFWKRGGGFKEDDAVWAEPKMPQNTGLPELKALNPDHCFVAALGTRIRLKASNI